MRQKMVVGNWKMNGSLAQNQALVSDLLGALPASSAIVVVCPPVPYLGQVQALLAGQERLLLGAQDVSRHDDGPYTGQVSAAMLSEFGVRYCLVGHSERRQGAGESDLDVAHKAACLLAHGITPIVCVGESLAERGQGQDESTVMRQLDAVLRVADVQSGRLAVAYEPVWAIGTGQSATPEQAQRMHALLRERLRATQGDGAQPILYGGSVDADNAPALLAQPDVDGALVGGAALRASEFAEIVATAG